VTIARRFVPQRDLQKTGFTASLRRLVAEVPGLHAVAFCDEEGEVIDYHSYLDPYETKVADGEILVEVRYPIRPGAGSAYEKVERRAGDWAVCAAGAFVVLNGGTISDVGIGIGAVNAPHFTAPDAEAFLIGKEPTAENLAAAAQMAADVCEPSSDQRGPEDYKKHLAMELTRRALTRAAAAAKGA